MTRKENWPTLLTNKIDSLAQAPFKWGLEDCALSAANIVKEYSGVDYAEYFRGRYKTKLGALKILRKHCDGTLKGSLTKILGEPVNIKLIHRGDIVLLPETKECAFGSLGVCFGEDSAFKSDALGFSLIPTLNCLCGWRI